MTSALVRETFLSAAGAAASLIDSVTDWDRPGLGSWNRAALVVHLRRGLATPLRYLDEEIPEGPVISAAAYLAAYLASGEEGRSGVAQRSLEEADRLDPAALPTLFREDLDRVRARLSKVQPDRVIATPFGVLIFDEYLRTRVLELTVHGLDLALALGNDWLPPRDALAMSARLLAELAVVEPQRGVAFLGLATGRSWAGVDGVLPLLR